MDWEVIEVCPYNGPDITRYRPSVTVQILAASDASVVAERSFAGTDPRACRQQEPWSLTELRGEVPVLGGEAAEWVASYVHPVS